jgi:anion-transporting  ArsA/GET3 family ATPase
VKELLKSRSVLVVLGSGGVGKTTIAAALGVAAATVRLRTAVITIDPARRLAQSLGLAELTNNPRLVAPTEEIEAAGGRLHAMMLDMRRTFDEMVQAHASPERAAHILENPFYQAISSSFAGTQ